MTKIYTKDLNARINLRISNDLQKRVSVLATRYGWEVSEMIRFLLLKGVLEYEDKQAYKHDQL